MADSNMLRDRKVASVFGSELMRARFAAKVKVNDATGCHEWQGCFQSCGYGQIRLEGKVHYAHHLAWRLRCDDIPRGMRVLHKCDNPKCVNVEHLFLGTQADNMADMKAKKRGRGEENSPKVTGNNPFLPMPSVFLPMTADERSASKRASFQRWYRKKTATVQP